MDVSLLGRWRNVCEPFRNREYGVLVAGTMLASFHFVEFVVVDTFELKVFPETNE